MDPSLEPKGRYITAVSYLEYPLSRGEIHITSKDVYANPDFTTGFLSHPTDLPPQILAYKKNREIIRRMSCYRGEYAPSHPSFPVGSAAVCRDIDFPKAETDTTNKIRAQGAEDEIIPDIEYSEEDDKAIESWVCDHIETTWHSMLFLTSEKANFRGTCAMKPKTQGGVVDKYLNVYGTQNLKVAGRFRIVES
jgi:alcohol oxidase